MKTFYDSESDDDPSLVVQEGGPIEAGGGYLEWRVYRMAHELGVAAHRLSLNLPKFEMYETGSQLRRAAKSVSANIVEGHGRRRYKAEFIRFLVFAKASLQETEEHLRYIRDCHPGVSETTSLLQTADALGRRLSRFLDGVEANHLS